MKLQLKLRAGASAAARRALHDTLAQHGATMRPLFPGDADAEVAALHVVEVPDEDAGKRVLKALQAATAVEFAEPEVRRKLIR